MKTILTIIGVALMALTLGLIDNCETSGLTVMLILTSTTFSLFTLVAAFRLKD